MPSHGHGRPCVITRRATFSASHLYWLPELSAAYSPGQMPLAQQEVLDAIITTKQPGPSGFTD